jgi:hypothetical protein
MIGRKQSEAHVNNYYKHIAFQKTRELGPLTSTLSPKAA